MSTAKTACALTLCLLAASCGPQGLLDGLAPAGRGRVVAAASGDSLVLAGGERVRLAGVEAPRADEPFGPEARAILASLAVGREVEFLSGGARQDRFGDTLAQVREPGGQGRWLEGALLRAGAARVRTWPDNRAMAAAMLLEEARARVAGRGLWALQAYQVRLPEEVGPDARGFTVVEGRVASVGEEGARAILGFGPSRFAAEIPPSARDDFSAAALEPASLRGRLVRVRGPVRPTFDGPRLQIETPEAVEILEAPRR